MTFARTIRNFKAKMSEPGERAKKADSSTSRADLPRTWARDSIARGRARRRDRRNRV